VFPEAAVTIDGETRDDAGRHFCPRCGSSVFGRSADEVEVNLGSLDAPTTWCRPTSSGPVLPRILAAAVPARPPLRPRPRRHRPFREIAHPDARIDDGWTRPTPPTTRERATR
jgi:hypothetical protein